MGKSEYIKKKDAADKRNGKGRCFIRSEILGLEKMDPNRKDKRKDFEDGNGTEYEHPGVYLEDGSRGKKY